MSDIKKTIKPKICEGCKHSNGFGCIFIQSKNVELCPDVQKFYEDFRNNDKKTK